jgi:hypothetical protein
MKRPEVRKGSQVRQRSVGVPHRQDDVPSGGHLVGQREHRHQRRGRHERRLREPNRRPPLPDVQHAAHERQGEHARAQEGESFSLSLAGAEGGQQA